MGESYYNSDVMYQLQDYTESAEFIKNKLNGFTPAYLIILGSGLGILADRVTDPVCIPYSEIPNFKTSTAPGHNGRLVCGKLGQKPVMVMQGRFHIYEGYTAEESAYPVRVAKLLGVHTLITTNAAGAINKTFRVGDLVALNDFIKPGFPDPLIGKNIPEFGPRFPDMTHVFDREYISIVRDIAEKQSIALREGVYMYAAGPRYETPAEIRAFRILGGDVVGMSTVHECICAAHAGMKILGISLVTNMAAGILDKPLTETEVIEEAEEAQGRFTGLLLAFLERI